MKFSIVSTDITPIKPEYFSGYGRKSKNIGVHDSLLFSLVTIVEKDYNLFIFSVDLLNVQKDFSDQLTFLINQKFPEVHNIILISATHTHSGPAVFPLPSLNQEVNKSLQNDLMKSALELVSKGMDNLSDVTHIEMGQGMIEGFYGNRNQKDGYGDKSFFTLMFMNNNVKLGAIVNLSCHPTILKADNLFFSADLFGCIRHQLEREWSCPALMLNGACGDSSSRFYSHSASFEEVDRIGNGIAEQIKKSKTTKKIFLDLKQTSYYQETINYTASEDKFWIEKKQEISGLNNQLEKKVLLENLNIKFSKINKFTILESKQILFKDLAIVTFSGELVGDFAREIRESVKTPILIVGYEHGYVSYIVNNDNYGKYFESFLSRLPKGKADSFIQNVINIIKQEE